MDTDEQLQLFGAPPGPVRAVYVTVSAPDKSGGWMISVAAATENRNRHMRVNIYPGDGVDIAPFIGRAAQIAIRSYYVGTETIRRHLVALLQWCHDEGHDAEGFEIGKPHIE